MTHLHLALESKLAELEHVVRKRDSIQVEKSADPLDESQSLQDRELAVEYINQNAVVLRAVRSALARVRDGSYGLCLDCEEEISQARLKAVPWASLCLKCQEQAEESEAA